MNVRSTGQGKKAIVNVTMRMKIGKRGGKNEMKKRRHPKNGIDDINEWFCRLVCEACKDNGDIEKT